MLAIILSTLAFAAALLAPRSLTGVAQLVPVERMERWLKRFGAPVCALLSIAMVWYVWGDAEPVAKVHDEVAYILQAKIFASGHWAAPSPPIPAFFEQPYVLVVPTVASKYPPGHSLLMIPGALVGFPALVPLLLTGISAALLFALASRVYNVWVGVLSWALWLTAPIVLRFHPSYFSELTTTAVLLGAWWSLLSWRETRRRRWLLLVAAGVGWCAITRPLTGVAYAIPIALVVIRDTIRLGLWRDFAYAVAVGAAVLAIWPIWSVATLGDWRESPYTRYRHDYMEYDKPGFGLDTTPPRRTETPVVKQINTYFTSAHREHTVARLPGIAVSRVVSLTVAFFQDWRLPLLVFAVVGLAVAGGPLRFALASVLANFLAYLTYAHFPPWTLYYLEGAPAVSALTAVGLWFVARRLLRDDRRAGVTAAATVVVLALFSVGSIRHWRFDHRARAGLDRLFAQQIRGLPRKPAIVFVRYTPRSPVHLAVVHNSPNLDAEPVWVVHDLGARNAELLRLAPNRESYEFDEDQLVGRPILR